jgi:hypothetical protein
MADHVHEYEPVISRPGGPEHPWEIITGYRCRCGQPKPAAPLNFDPIANVRAAAALFHRGAGAWKAWRDA